MQSTDDFVSIFLRFGVQHGTLHVRQGYFDTGAGTSCDMHLQPTYGVAVDIAPLRTDGRTGGRTNGRTDEGMDGRADEKSLGHDGHTEKKSSRCF